MPARMRGGPGLGVRLALASLALALTFAPAQAAPRQAQPTQRPAQQAQGALPEPDPRRTPVVRVVQEAGPAVVSVITLRPAPAPATAAQGQRNAPEAPATPPKPLAQQQNIGSGVIIDGSKAYILTNAHVITGASKITVRLQDGRLFQATLLGVDQDVDLAVLRLNVPVGAPPLPQARMGDSDGLLIGEPVVAIGSPFGLTHTVTTGVISAVDRSGDTGQHIITGLIQTDAAINPGNSGGPLLNILGQVVGINAAVYTKGGGLGFAIPINKARRVLDELITTGRVAHIWLGLLGENMTPEQIIQYGLARPGGMVVTDVFPNTPAEGAGIRPGDALLAIGGQRVQDKAQFLGLLLSYTRGDTLSVLLSRGTEQFQVQLRPKVLDREAGLELLNWRWGFTPVPRAALGGMDAGVAVAEVRPNTPAARLGLKPGDSILQVGNLRTPTEADLLTAFFRYQLHNLLLLNVQRGNQTTAVRLKI